MAKKKRAAKRNPKRSKKKRARAANPTKKRKRARASNPPKKRRRRASNPRSAAKRPRRRNSAAGRPRRTTRRRRRNPGWGDKVGMVLKGLAAGVIGAIGSAWLNDGPLGQQSEGIRNLALVGEVGAVVYYVDDFASMIGAVVGIALVPAGNIVYGFLPGLAAPGPMGAPALTAAAGPMGALHQNNVKLLRGVDKKMGALHRGSGMGALHRNMSALHRPMGAFSAASGMHHDGMGALHTGTDGMGALPQVRTATARSFSRYGRQ